MKRLSHPVKGIIIGLVICVVLETAMIMVFNYLTSGGVMHFQGLVGIFDYYFPIIAIFIFSALIAWEIARDSRDFEKASVVVSIALTLCLGSNYLYFWWWWHNNLPHFLSFDINGNN
jgi:hypothetical protein